MYHIIALSGGKDSTAMALRLAEVEPQEVIYNVVYVLCDMLLALNGEALRALW